MSISEWLNDVIWDAKGSVPISPKWFDKYVGNGKHVNLILTCPFCDTTTRLSCGNCGNEILATERRGPNFIFKCASDNKHVADFSYDEDMNEEDQEFEEKTLRCPSCGSKVPTSLFCEISYASIDDSLRQLYGKAAKEKQTMAQVKIIRRNKAIERREKAFKFLSDLMLTPDLILDSNIWMNPGYDSFFKALEDILSRDGKALTLYSPQFDEICNVKRNTRHGSERYRHACCALKRIEGLQAAGFLNIEPLTVDSDDGVNGDHLIVKLIKAQTRHGKDVSFLSDDMELRIRVRGLMGRNAGDLFIFQGRDFLPMRRIGKLSD